ncbi:Ribosomal protein 63, mitochondrial [Tyrophagus putrescentiae]|nr:Ribosomal protein 63, mitochondrial [Tyrophagus putrescentiae]
MRLSLILNSFRREFIGPIPKHPGNVLRGKKRFVPPVTISDKINLVRELKYEEEVMKFLQKPYITESQEKQYLEATGQSKPEYWDDFTRKTIEEPLPQHYAADYLEKFNVNRSFCEED